MQEKTNKPALRFKGFDEDWEQRKVSDVANRFIIYYSGSCKSSYSWNNSVLWCQWHSRLC